MLAEEILESNMVRIKELTHSLEFPFANTIHSVTAEEINFNMENGTMKATRMEKNEHYASVLVSNSCGAVFPFHSHKENEYMIVIKGWVEVHTYDGKTARYESGEVGIITANTVHKCTMMDGSVILVITIPPSKEF